MKKLLFIVPLLVAGCMGGSMQGVISSGDPITMNYEQGFSSDTYSTVVDGENFSGRAVPIDRTSSFATVYGSAYSNYGGSISSNATSFGSSSGGKFKAVLIGDKGSSLKCILQYADTGGFTSSGGVGECVHSDGRTVDLSW